MTAVQRIADLSATLAGMSDAAQDGAAVDLTGLDAAIDQAMNEVKAAPTSEHARLRDTMAALIAALDRLGAAMTKQHHAATQQRAAAAYGAGQPTPTPNPAPPGDGGGDPSP